MLRLFEKKIFLWMSRKISFIRDQNAGHGDRMAEAWIDSERPRDSFVGLGGHYAYQETLEFISRGSACTPFLVLQISKIHLYTGLPTNRQT